MRDLIDRQEALEELEDWERCYTWDEHCRESEEDYIVSPSDVIIKLPSAQQETAKRIVGKSRDGMTLWYQCDMCNEPVDVQDNFCRGCGRRLTDG